MCLHGGSTIVSYGIGLAHASHFLKLQQFILINYHANFKSNFPNIAWIVDSGVYI